jgi:hypothetical protein
MTLRDLKDTKIYVQAKTAFERSLAVPLFVHHYKTKKPEIDWTDSWALDFDETSVTVERVIAYWSRTLKSAERNYSATEREALAAKEGLVHFQPFIEGEHILLITDHAALQWARTYENTNRRLAAWGAVYAAYPGLEILHRAGKIHSNVDPLSRLPRIPDSVSPTQDEIPTITSASLSRGANEKAWDNRPAEKAIFLISRELVEPLGNTGDIAQTEWDLYNLPRDDSEDAAGFASLHPQLLININRDFTEKLRDGYKKDPAFRSHYSVEVPSPNAVITPSHYFVDEKGLLYFRDSNWRSRICVPSSVSAEILKLIHDNPYEGAHASGQRLFNLMKDRFFWPRMLQDCVTYARSCDVCQKTKNDHSARQGALRPADVPGRPFETISMDLITGLPPSGKEQYSAIFVAVDKLTRFVICVPTMSNLSAEGFAQVFVKRVASPFGLPRRIICDRDKRWTCRFWREVCRVYGSMLALSSAHHPQTDGQTENMNAMIEQTLRAYCASARENWSEWVEVVVHTYNSTVHSSTNYAPAFLLMGYIPRGMSRVLGGDDLVVPRELSDSPMADQWIIELENHRQAAKDSIARAQETQARAYNKGRRLPEEIAEGDLVLVNPHSLELLESKGTGRKLIQRRMGPFEVLERINSQVFRLKIPPEYLMHPVINREHLKKYHSSPKEFGQRESLPNPRKLDRSEEEYEVEAIVDYKRHRNRLLFRVRWKGYGPEEDSWLNSQNLRNAPALLRAYRSLHGI